MAILSEVFTVDFKKRSEEEDQLYFDYEMIDYTESGIMIRLNFSNPILVSQGDQADLIRITLLNSFFLEPKIEG